MKRLVTLAAAISLLIAACASDDGGSQALTPESLPVADAAAASSGVGTTDDPIAVEPDGGTGNGRGGSDLPEISTSLTSEVELAVADLAGRLGSNTLIEVMIAHELTWPDGSLGCPQPDTLSTQALVEGYRIELSDGTETYAYHGAVREAPFLCESAVDDGNSMSSGRDESDPPDSPSAPPPPIVAAAVTNLSERLGVPEGVIAVVSHEGVTWPDSSIGCPSKGLVYMQVLTTGTLTILAVDGIRYRYHSRSDGAPFLCLIPTDPVPPGAGDT